MQTIKAKILVNQKRLRSAADAVLIIKTFFSNYLLYVLVKWARCKGTYYLLLFKSSFKYICFDICKLLLKFFKCIPHRGPV